MSYLFMEIDPSVKNKFWKLRFLQYIFYHVYISLIFFFFQLTAFSISKIKKKNTIFSSQLNECQTKCRYTIMFCQMIYDFFVCAASVYYGKALVLNNPYDSNLDVSFLREMLNFVWGRHKNITRCLCIWQRLSMERG